MKDISDFDVLFNWLFMPYLIDTNDMSSDLLTL